MSCCQHNHDNTSQENQTCCQNKKKGFFSFFANLFGGKKQCCRNHTEQKAEEGTCCRNKAESHEQKSCGCGHNHKHD